MPPHIPTFNLVWKPTADSVFSGNDRAGTWIALYACGLRVSKFRILIHLSKSARSVRSFIRFISRSRVPSKVAELAIRWVSVIMATNESARAGANESQQDKDVNCFRRDRSKSNPQVIQWSAASLRFQYPFFPWSLLPVFVNKHSAHGFNSTMAGCFIAWVAGDFLPDFFHHIISLKMIPYEAHGRQVREPAFRSVELSAQAGL